MNTVAHLKSDILVTALVTLISGLGGALLGARAVWRTQTRALRLSEQSIANALLQDLRRIESMLPQVGPHGHIALHHISDAHAYPSIHEWVKPLITDLASRDASVVGGFMALEPMLEENRTLGNAAWSADVDLARLTGEMVDRQAQRDDPNKVSARKQVEFRMAEVEELLEASRRQQAESASVYRAQHAKLLHHLGELRDHLHIITTASIPQSLYW
ncbi:MAG: hypothetical protein JWM41_2037 [Gemmatimonadetes bacterium]|nr:hypothetical protein [Gemmatimonadota bacterium]